MRKMSLLLLFLRYIQPPLDSIFKGRKNSGRLFRFLSFTEKPAQKAFLNLLDYVSTYACSTRHRVIASLSRRGEVTRLAKKSPQHPTSSSSSAPPPSEKGKKGGRRERERTQSPTLSLPLPPLSSFSSTPISSRLIDHAYSSPPPPPSAAACTKAPPPPPPSFLRRRRRRWRRRRRLVVPCRRL